MRMESGPGVAGLSGMQVKPLLPSRSRRIFAGGLHDHDGGAFGNFGWRCGQRTRDQLLIGGPCLFRVCAVCEVGFFPALDSSSFSRAFPTLER